MLLQSDAAEFLNALKTAAHDAKVEPIYWAIVGEFVTWLQDTGEEDAWAPNRVRVVVVTHVDAYLRFVLNAMCLLQRHCEDLQHSQPRLHRNESGWTIELDDTHVDFCWQPVIRRFEGVFKHMPIDITRVGMVLDATIFADNLRTTVGTPELRKSETHVGWTYVAEPTTFRALHDKVIAIQTTDAGTIDKTRVDELKTWASRGYALRFA